MTARERKLRGTNRILSAAVLALCLLGAAGMFWVGGQLSDIQSRMHPTPQEERRRLEARIRVDGDVEEEIGRLADDLAADRVVVGLMHNGATDLSGKIPFMFVSNAYVHLRPGVMWSEPWSRPQPLSMFSGTLRRVFKDPEHPVCARRGIGDPDIAPSARAFMRSRGVERWITCPLHGKEGPVGFLLAEWLHAGAMVVDPDVAARRTEETAATVHKLLVSAR